jgi:hypothetical protein
VDAKAKQFAHTKKGGHLFKLEASTSTRISKLRNFSKSTSFGVNKAL